MTEQRRAYLRAWRVRNRDKESVRQKNRYRANRDEILKRGKERYRLNREKKLATNAKWRAANPNKGREYTKAWVKRNPGKALERARIQSHKRRQSSRSGTCDIQSINLLSQLIRSSRKMKCAICRKNMRVNDRSIDHVIPLSKGGSGDFGNLQVVHRKCNAMKYAKMPHELDGQMQIHLVGRVA